MQLIKSPAVLHKDQVVIYEVNLTIDNEVIDEFDVWLKKHVDEMLAIPGFISASTAVIENDDENTKQRSVQFLLSNQQDLDAYFENDAERMRAIALDKFSNKMTALRRVLTPSQAALAEEAACANCGSQLEGRFCSSCGQREEPRVPTFMTMLREVTNAMLGLESKLWRSIALLLFKPGRLTAAYLSGKRQRYTSPFRLYLIFSIVTFAFVTFAGTQGLGPTINVNNQNSSQAEAIPDKATLTTQVNSNAGDTQNTDTKSEDEENFEKEIDKLELPKNINIDPKLKQILEEVLVQFKEKVIKIKDDVKNGNGKQVIAALLRPLPTALLIFLPFVALAFKVLYLGSGKYYIEHLIYLLHNHSFLFALVILSILAVQLGHYFPSTDDVFSIPLALIWGLYVPYYLYRSMRVVYKRSRWITIPSFFLIFMVYMFLFTIMLAISVLIAGFTYS